MRLLVSVRGSVEARAAVAGGADVIDAKDPARGPLGAVRRDRLAAIRLAVGAARPVSAARRGAASATALVLVAYADWRRAPSLAPDRLVAVAVDAGAAGLLLDTVRKDAPLFAIESPDAVAAWVAAVHAAGLFAALAGSLSGRGL